MDSSETLGLMAAALAEYTAERRLYALEGEGPLAGLMVERWHGWEGVSSGFELTVDALSTDAFLSLDDMLGASATLRTALPDGSGTTRSGLVREALCLGSDGGLTRYRLHIVPWTWLMTRGRHSRVFQDLTLLDILAAVFSEYHPYAAWRWADDVAPFLAERRPRSYCVQYRESDYDFAARLMAEEGLAFVIEETDDAPAGHTLTLFADSRQRPESALAAAQGGLRYHRAASTEPEDAIQALTACLTLGSTQLTLLSSDYKQLMASSAMLPLDGGGDDSVRLECYDPAGPWAYADSREAEHYATLAAQAHDARCELWRGRGTVRGLHAGTGFELHDAPWQGDQPPQFWLVDLQHAGINNLPDTVRRHLSAPFEIAWADAEPRHEHGGAAPAAPEPALWQQAEAHGYAQTFSAIPRERVWRPVLEDDTGARLNPRPTALGPQTAIVVGPDGSPTPQGHHALHIDRLGRIRVRFHWQQADGVSAQDSCWLRVAQRYAGPGVGQQFLPRIGQEVLVQFIGGDIDRPVVLGALYNGQGEGGIPPTPGGREAARDEGVFQQAADHRPSAQGNLAGGNSPPWHGMSPDAEGHRNAAALSGWRTQEFGGSGYNQLVFDDSDGQGRIQLHASYAHAQLNLGHLIHQQDNDRGSFRGEGWELRSDAWGSVRSQGGLLLSTYSLGTPDEAAGDVTGATALLRQHADLAAALSPAAIAHQTVRLAAHEGVPAANASQLRPDSAPLAAHRDASRHLVPGDVYAPADTAKGFDTAPGDNKVPHSGAAQVTLAGRGGLGVIAGTSLHLAAGESLNLASGRNSHLAVGGDLRLHSGQALGWLAGAAEPSAESGIQGWQLTAAQGELDVQAQHDALKLRARDGVKLVSINDVLELAAGKTVHLATAGGAAITIEDGNLTLACPGKLTVNASKKSFTGGTQLSREMNAWPETELDERVQLFGADGEPAANRPYDFTRADGAVISGVTDSGGWTSIQKSEALEGLGFQLTGPVT